MARGTGRPDRNALALNVRRLRKQLKWSQERLAAEAGELRQSLISDLELAKANPTLITLESIAGALGVPDPSLGLYDLARQLDAPRSLREIGMPEGGIDQAADLAVTNPYWNPLPIERSAVRDLIARAWSGAPPHIHHRAP